jgi:hypothetical protein
MQEQAASLAVQGAYLGTSSWKYEGWMGQLYNAERYEYRGRVAKTRFERDCLREYAEVFKTVCVDAAYYTFPSRQYLEGMAEKVPEDFLFGFKVTDAITIKKYPKLDRFGAMAGKPNENFLNADVAFLDQHLDLHPHSEAGGQLLPDRARRRASIPRPRSQRHTFQFEVDIPLITRYWRGQ